MADTLYMHCIFLQVHIKVLKLIYEPALWTVDSFAEHAHYLSFNVGSLVQTHIFIITLGQM